MRSIINVSLPVLLVFLVKVCVAGALSDTTYVYLYDDSGNRTSRVIDLSKSAQINENQSSLINEDIFFTGDDPESEIRIYPNPTKGIVKIEFPETKTEGRVQVFSSSGLLVLDRRISKQRIRINLSDQAPGLYVLKILTPGGSSEWKILKD